MSKPTKPVWPFFDTSNKNKSNIIETQEVTDEQLIDENENILVNKDLLSEAISLHEQGTAGDKTAVIKSYEILQDLWTKEPQNPIVAGYFGSVQTLMGRDAIDPTERFNKVLEGLKILDEVIEKNLENIQVRILRGNVCFRLPENFFHRTQTAIEDFSSLISSYQKDNNVFTEEYYWQLFYDLGMAYKNVSQFQKAKDVWLQLLDITSDSKYEKLIKQQGIKAPKKKPAKESGSTLEKVQTSESFATKQDVLKEEQQKLEQNIEQILKKKELKEGIFPSHNAIYTKQRHKGKKQGVFSKVNATILSEEKTPKKTEEIEPLEEQTNESLEQENYQQESSAKFSEEALELYNAALKGDKEAITKAYEYFDAAYKANPEDPLISAYYANCLSMTGSLSKIPTNMFGSAINASKILDQAVNLEPENMQIRYIRGYQSFRLPEGFFRRTTTAITDFAYLIKAYEEGNKEFSREIYWQLLFDLGIAYKRLAMLEEAEAVWSKLISTKPPEKYFVLINKEKGIDLQSTINKLSSLKDKADLLEAGIKLHDLGVEGDKNAVDLANKLFKQLHEIYPDDAVILGYYGSSHALLGRDSNNPSTMFGNAIQGLDMLKKAVGKDAANPKLKLLRGNVFQALPEAFFPLGDKAIKDLRFVVNAYEQGNRQISEETYWQVLYDLGKLYRQTNDYKKMQKTWKKLLNSCPNPKYKEMIDIDIEE